MPDTSVGAANNTGLMTIGMRTTCPLSPVSVSCPPVYALSAADVRVNLTVNDFAAPAPTDPIVLTSAREAHCMSVAAACTTRPDR